MQKDNFYSSRKRDLNSAKENAGEIFQKRMEDINEIRQRVYKKNLERLDDINSMRKKILGESEYAENFSKKTPDGPEYILLGKHLSGNPNGTMWIVSRGSRTLVTLAKKSREQEPNAQSTEYIIKPYKEYLKSLKAE